MSDKTDLDQIAALEERITAALDRISAGMAARGKSASEPTDDEDTVRAAEAASARIEELGNALAEAQATLSAEQTAHADLNERMRALEAARQADADEAGRKISGLEKDLEEARAAGAGSEELPEEVQQDLERRREVEDVLRRRLARVRTERSAAREERNEAREQLDEALGKLDQAQAKIDSGAPGVSSELARLRDSNRVLRETIEELRESIDGADVDGDLVSSALAAELESLRAERASEAAEARAILAEIRPVLEGGAANA